ncbi:MAG: adenosine deaminase [Woeseia sp.]
MKVAEIPKVELHCHLEACFRTRTVMEIGKSLGIDMPVDPQRFHDDWLLTRPLANLQVALERFVDIQRIWCSEEVIERLTFEACEDARAQNIRIMEFRYSPDFIAADKPGLTFDKIHGAILRGLARAEHPSLAVGLIGIVQKTLPLKDAARTVAFMAEHADSFVGIDFADRDTHPLEAYRPLVDIARRAGLRLTVHAGEEPGSAQQVRDSINILGAERIGHGIHIIDNPEILALVRDKGVVLEVCPTSNWLTSSVSSTAEHPIKRLQNEGIKVTVNSDDPSLFGIDLTHEYRLLAQEHGYTEHEFAACNELAAAASFISVERRAAVWPATPV